MKKTQRAAIITRLADELRGRGSWCGETHLQKATYFLQEATGLDLGLDFVLYKHGPFSFDFRSELVSYRADGLLRQASQPYPYGPRLLVTERAHAAQERYPKTLEDVGHSITAVADFVDGRDVASLERVATALYFIGQGSDEGDEKLAERIVEAKPHVSFEEALKAVTEVRSFLEG